MTVFIRSVVIVAGVLSPEHQLRFIFDLVSNDFYLIWEFLRFGLTEKALFQVILGLLLVYADWEKGV